MDVSLPFLNIDVTKPDLTGKYEIYWNEFKLPEHKLQRNDINSSSLVPTL